MLRNIARVAAQGTRQISQSSRLQSGSIPQGYKDLKKIQESFQKHDGLPVHLKGGMKDRVLYAVTASLCGIGLGGIVKLFYDLAMPHN